MIRTYSELIKLPTFEERLKYLMVKGKVGAETFGFDRWLNQHFYNTEEWKRIRREVIIRDRGLDLGVDGYDIYGSIIIHHMNPILVRDIVERSDHLLKPEYLISTSFNTHQVIHYNNEEMLKNGNTYRIATLIERLPNDTSPWKKIGG